LERGAPKAFGNPDEVIEAYLGDVHH